MDTPSVAAALSLVERIVGAMKSIRLRITAAGLLMLLACLIPLGVAHAQSATTMVIEVPAPSDVEPAFTETNLDFFGTRYAAFANGVRCVAGDVPEDGGAFSIVLGEEDQPLDCQARNEGAIVEIAGLGGPIAFTQEGNLFQAALAPGTTITQNNWAPYPSSTPFPLYVCDWLVSEGVDAGGCPPDLDPTDTTMVIHMPEPQRVDPSHFATINSVFGDVYAVFADGELCIRDTPPADGTGFSILLGDVGQPAACGRPGAEIDFARVNPNAGEPIPFVTEMASGTEVRFEYVKPIVDYAFYPAYMCAFFAAEGAWAACPNTPDPAAVGHGVTTAGPNSSIYALILAGLVPLLAGARRVTKPEDI